MDKIIEHRISTILFAILVALVVLVCINPFELLLINRGGEFAAQFMLGLLALGLLFMVLDYKKYMLISLIGSGIIAFFLKAASNENLVLPSSTTQPKITIAHFNASNIEGNLENISSMLEDLEVDLVSIQELTPDWNIRIKNLLSKKYLYQKTVVRIDPFGIGIYSNKPLVVQELIDHKEKPILNVAVKLGEENIHIVSSYVLPPFAATADYDTRDHLSAIAGKIEDIQNPKLSIGDFNLVYWSNEIREFREKSSLKNSRRNVSLNSFEVPYNHMFYSDGLECVFFEELRGFEQNRIGIVGTYQLDGRVF